MSYTITMRAAFDPDRLVSTERNPRDGEVMMFRLLDDDEVVYYEGLATDEHAVLDALDRFQESDGCTLAQIEVFDAHGYSTWAALN